MSKKTTIKNVDTVTPETPTTEPMFNMDEAVKTLGSVSAVIRDLAMKGHTRGTIAKMTGKRYQHVRNVLVAPVKKGA